MKEKVSLAVVRRLPRYYRYLGELQRQGVDKISSGGLAEKMGLTASQIRQDLNCFGGFGQQGYGYNVEMLRGEIASILGLPRQYRTVLIGVGNLGRALVSHVGFEKRGFSLIGLFDVREDVIGTRIGAHTVLPMSELEAFCLRERPEAAVLSLPRAAAPEVADRLVALGVKGFWNFSNGEIVEGEIPVENVHLGDSLMTLCYRIQSEENQK